MVREGPCRSLGPTHLGGPGLRATQRCRPRDFIRPAVSATSATFQPATLAPRALAESDGGEPAFENGSEGLVGVVPAYPRPREQCGIADVGTAAGTATGRDLSQISHRLTGRHWTRADGLDIQWTLTCGYGFRRTDRTGGIDLRIKRQKGRGDYMSETALIER